MANMDFQEVNQSTSATPPTLTTPLPSPTPLQLSGFLTGDTIQVQGDTGNLQFSVQLNINKKLFPEKVAPLDHSLETVEHTPQKFSIEDFSPASSSSSSSSYVTPIASEHNDCRFEEEEGEIRRVHSTVVTRLQSGVISPVTYYPRISLSCWEKLAVKSRKKKKKKKKKKIDVFERLFRRHSCPIRPCTSYAFFVMATWGEARSTSFGETSKRLGQMWCELPHEEKKLYEDMALKDGARYKRQSKLLKSKAAQRTQRR